MEGNIFDDKQNKLNEIFNQCSYSGPSRNDKNIRRHNNAFYSETIII